MTKQRDHRNSPIDSSTRDRLSAEFRERWVRAGQPTLVHHTLGNMSQAHNVPLGILKNIAREVRSARVTAMRRAANAPLPLAVVDGSNLAWARTDAEGRPRLDNLIIVRQALTERGYQAVVVVDAALRHQVSPRDASELERLIQGQDVVQAPAATDGDEWVLRIAEHNAARVISNDRYDEYSAVHPWVAERRIAAIFVDHSALFQGAALDGAGLPPSSPSKLRDEVDQLRQLAAKAQSSADDAAALRGRVARLEAHLAREQGRAATLQADVARLEAAVDEERRSSDTLRGQLREFPEQIERLMCALSETREDAETMREERDQLRARVDDLTRQAEKAQAKQPQGERNAPATHADIDALRRELRDLSRAASEGKSPLPRILAMTREVREAVAEVRSTANRSVEASGQAHCQHTRR
jgi:hypothetical protein